MISLERAHFDEADFTFGFDMDGVAQRPAEAIELYFHPITILELDAVTEAERVRAEEVHMHIARLAMVLKLEVVMFEIRQAVAHVPLAGCNQIGRASCRERVFNWV